MTRPIESWRWNALYLLAASSTIIMTLSVGLQPLFLSEVLGVSGRDFGAINAGIQVAAEAIGLFLILYLGNLSDHIGRKRIIFSGFLVAMMAMLLVPLSPFFGAVLGIGGLGFYLLMRIATFLGMAAVWPQLSTLAGDYTEFSNRPAKTSKYYLMVTFGGAVIYAILMQIPEHGGLYLVMFLPAVIAFFSARMVIGSLTEVAPRLPGNIIPWKRIRAVFSDEPRMQLSLVSAFFSRSDMILIGIFLMLWLMKEAELAGLERGEAAAQAGILLGLVGVVMLLACRPWGHIIERYGRVTAIAVGMALSGAGFLMFGVMDDPFDPMIIIPVVLVGLGQAGCLIAPQVLALDLVPKDLRGTIMGVFYAVGGVGVIFFVQSGGILYDIVGPHAPFVLIAIGNILVMTYALSIRPTDVGEEVLNRKKKIGFKPVIFVICLLPLLVPLLWLVDHGGVAAGSGLGGLPLGYWNRYLGDWGLNFLLLSLALRPMRELTGAAYLARYNRMVGLYASFYVFLHFVTYLWLEWDLTLAHMWADFIKRYFILFGVVAFAMLTVLTITSSKSWVKKLGGHNWKNLHRSIYVVNILVGLHFTFASLTAGTSYTKTFIYITLMALLLGYRVRQYRQTHSPGTSAGNESRAKKVTSRRT
jgi:DMSO/TMAO reductase YedYZ heme-binding membrane subunit